MNDFLRFNPSKPYTLGVELEFQFLDKETYNLTQAAPDILAKVPGRMSERIKPEFIQSMAEVATTVCPDIEAVDGELRETIAVLEQLAVQQGFLLFAASLHPFAAYNDQLLTRGERYGALMEELQIAGRRLISQGLHIHVGLPDGDTVVRVCDTIRQYLPLLLALSSSSPYYGGERTGFYSYRSQLLDSLARGGLPYTFRNWENFQGLMAVLHQAGVINNVRDIWWDVRPHPDYGTVEIRICDLPTRYEEILAMVALVQSLVITLAEEPDNIVFPVLEIISNNKWQAARHGLDGRFIDLDNITRPLDIRQAILKLLNRVEAAARASGCASRLEIIPGILQNGTGANRMLNLMEKTGSFPETIEIIRKDFWK